MLFSLILVSCVGSSAHDVPQSDEVVRDVPAPNTGSGSDGRFTKSKLLPVFNFHTRLNLFFIKRYVRAKWNFLLPVIVVV